MRQEGGPGDEWDSHVLLLCRDEDFRRRSVAGWLQRGLDRGEKILWTDVPGDAAWMSSLPRDEAQVSRAMEVGQLSLLPLEEFYPPGGLAVLVRSALHEGYPGVRIGARAEAAIDHLGEDGYRSVERQVDELCAGLPVSELCQFDVDVGAGTTFGTVVDAHPDAVRDVEMHVLRRGDWLSVGGEVDFGSAPALAEALQRACKGVQVHHLTLDLTELSFVDVAACRAICTGTDVFRRGGGVVLLQHPQPHVERVLTLLGVDRLDRVELA